MALYDTIGKNYNTTRRADPYIAGRLHDLLAPDAGGIYLDIGCGTGNYLNALAQKGLQFCGIDPSKEMLKTARQGNNGVTFIRGAAEKMPLPDGIFLGATAVLTIHHWGDKLAGLRETNRVLKPGASAVFFTFTPEQMRGYWLCHYFPQMMEAAMRTIPSLAEMELLLGLAGFTSIYTEPYFVSDELQDHFMYSNKRKPENYLLEEVRYNASAFSALATREEVEHGVASLRSDIESGKINDIMGSYENDLGDYLFVKATK